MKVITRIFRALVYEPRYTENSRDGCYEIRREDLALWYARKNGGVKPQ